MSRFAFHVTVPQPARLSLEVVDKLRDVLVSEYGAGVLLRAGASDAERRCYELQEELDRTTGRLEDLLSLREGDRAEMRKAAEQLIVAAERDIDG